jgi:hypothetical protein
MFHNVVEKQNPRQSKKLTPKTGSDDGVAFVSGIQYIIFIKDSEGSMQVSAHASTVHAVLRINSKNETNLNECTFNLT